jgi:hypothetical protein
MLGDSFSTGIVNKTDIYLILELAKSETYLFIVDYVLYPLHLHPELYSRNVAIHSNYYN